MDYGNLPVSASAGEGKLGFVKDHKGNRTPRVGGVKRPYSRGKQLFLERRHFVGFGADPFDEADRNVQHPIKNE
jgi:hypothetical protein